MKHLSEEDLILYHYREPDCAAETGRHLENCTGCRERYNALESCLSAASEAKAVPERGEDYGRVVWLRLHARLAGQEPMQRPTWSSWRTWALAGAVASLMILAFQAGRYWPRQPASAPAISAQAGRTILLAQIGDHLDRSAIPLLELANAAPRQSADISREQQRAADLIAANRLYRHRALEAGDQGLAAVLDELERVLLEIANGPARLSPAELDQFQKRIENQELLFKLRVVGSQLRERSPAGSAQDKS